MSRNLLSSAITYLETADSVKVAHLVRLELAESEDAAKVYTYLTDYQNNIVHDGKTYEAGKITRIGDIRQGQGLKNYKLSVEVAGEFPEELAKGLVENLDKSYVGKDIEVLRAYIDVTGAIIDFDDVDGNDIGTGNKPMQYFIGDITDISIQEGVTSGVSKVIWQCAGKFSDFTKINGRITEDDAHRGLESDPITGVVSPSDGAKKLSHQSDTGFQHAAKTIDVVTKYTATETSYKMKKRHWWQSDKLVSYEAEVERTLELGIDLAAKFIPKVYGVRKVPGIPVFLDALKSDPTQIYVVYAFAEGAVDSFLNFYIDGEPVICASNADTEARVCLGNQANGDTLSAFIAPSAESEYDTLIEERFSGESSGDSPGYYIPKIPPVVGTDRTTGTEHIKGTTGGNNLDDELINYFTITNDTGTKEIMVHHGLSNQNANQVLVNIAASNGFLNQQEWFDDPNNPAASITEYWDNSSQLLDTAYVVLKFGINDEETSMPEIEAVVSGSLVSTYDAAGSETTDVYSLNPVWHLLEYITNTICGGEVPLDLINFKSFYDVALEMDAITDSYDNEWLTYWRYVGWKDTPQAQGSGDDPQKTMMQCNTLINTERTVTQNIQALLSQFDATLNILGGKYHLSVENDAASIADIDISDVIGSIKTKDLSNRKKWNSIQAAIVDPANGWGSTQINFFDSTFLEKDNGIKKKGNVGFNHITNYYTAREWAARQLKKSRFSREIAFTTYHKFSPLYPNANVTFSYDRFWVGQKKFRVVSTTMHSDGRIGVVLEDYDSSIYDADKSNDNSGEVTPITPAVEKPIGLEYVPLPDARFDISTANTEDVYGILVWEDPTNTKNIARYDVRDWQEVTTDFTVPYSQTILDTGDAKTKHYIFITSLESSTLYKFKVRTISKFGKGSKYAVLEHTTDAGLAPVSYTTITGLEATNVTPSGNFDGGVVNLIWDNHTNALVTEYHIEVTNSSDTVLSTVTRNQAGTIQTPSTGEYFVAVTNSFDYTLALNKLNYSDNNASAIGAYRDIKFRVRAADGHGAPAVFSEWTELII